MSFILLMLATVPLPTHEQGLMIHKQVDVSTLGAIPGDYWNESHAYDVLHYLIDMTVDIPADSVWAEVILTIQARDTFSTIPLNFHWSYDIESVKEDERELTWSNVMIDTFRIFLDREVAVGETLSVTVSFHGKPGWSQGQGLYIDDEGECDVTFTNCEPQGARLWIPCWDDPSDKATFTQRITVPAGNEVVANGTLESFTENGDWWSYTWEEHYPQPTYLIAFAASENFVTTDTFAVVDGTQLPMTVWVLASNDVSNKFDQTRYIMEYYSDIFPPYPFLDEKYDQVHAPIGGAMENTTCTFFNTYADWGEDWSWVVAHEMSHDWWGDWLTCATWADLWLNEGFATYCEVLWWEELYGEEGRRAYARYIMDLYLDYGQLHPIYDPPSSDLFGVTTYEKGGSVLHMMRQVLGDEVFFDGLNTYGYRHADEAVITDDFQAVMEEVAGQGLDWFFDEWIYGPGHPHYEIGWRVTPKVGNLYDVEFALAQTQNKSSNYYPYRMPVEVAVYSDGIEELFTIVDSLGYQRFTIEVSSEPDSFRFDPYDKVLHGPVVYHDDIDDVPDPGITESQPVTASSLMVDHVISEVMHVRFSQPGNDRITISLYDASGRLVRNYYTGRSQELYRVYPVAHLSPGVYFVHVISSDGSAMSAKTVKIR